MKIPFLFLINLLIVVSAYGQNLFNGKIVDRDTKEPLAFANVIFNNDQFSGARSDIDGKISFNSPVLVRALTCSYIGYKKKNIQTDTIQNMKKVLLIEMEPLTNELQEVVIKPGENPAEKIIRKVINNRESNNPENIPSFRYTSYNKTIYDFLFNDLIKADSIEILRKMQGGHLLIMESVTERKFISPDISEENVIGTKVSGFKNPSFVTLATDFQPFSFYENSIKLFDINYLNPISNGSPGNYKFIMEDTLFQNSDTVYVIAFSPRPKKNFDGLTGVLYINTNGYAVQNVIASPSVPGKIDLKIQQQYRIINNKFWFPEQLNYVLRIREYPTKKIGMAANGRSYIYNVEFDVPLDKKDFSYEAVKMDELASKRDSVFWKSNRPFDLNHRELVTYRVLDSLGERRKFGNIQFWLEKLSQNRIPFKFIDLDIQQTLVYNKYEGNRIGLGLYTNEKIFKNLSLGGFLGYGLKDGKWKYGGEIKYDVLQEHGFSLSIRQQNNLIETGSYGLNLLNYNGYNLRNYIAYQMDNVEQSSLNIGIRVFRYSKVNVVINHFKTSPLYAYEFLWKNQKVTNYYNSEVLINLKFAYKERIVNSLNQNISMGTKYPVLYLTYTRGIKDLLRSDFSYNKIEARVDHSFFIKNFGTTRYRLEGGIIDRPLPYGLLFTGEGGFDRSYPFDWSGNFQTMKPYEFLSDRYTNLFLSHNFGSLLFHINKFRPEISLHNKLGWGNLTNKGSQRLIEFKTKEKIYLETGIKIDNVIKINYLNLGYIGFGSGIYYRYGYYSNSDFKDNLAFKIAVTFTIR